MLLSTCFRQHAATMFVYNSRHMLLRPQMHHRNHWFGNERTLAPQKNKN